MDDVLILGGGFGGLYTAKRVLKRTDADVHMISDRNYFLFIPLLHEVATGNLHGRNIVQPVREVVDDASFSFERATVESIDLEENEVETSAGEREYDYVVHALGSTANYFGIDGAEEHCYTMKSMSDATGLRNSIIDNFEAAEHADSPEDTLRTVIVGGGPTGVELACEIAEWSEALCELYDIPSDTFELHLVDLNEKVLNGVDEKLRDHAMHVLERRGVHLHMDTAAEEVENDSIQLSDGTELVSDTVVWAAGVKPVDVPVNGVEKQRGYVPVEQDLSIEGYEDAFAIGDVAGFANPDGSTFPPTAQLAYRQAFAAGDNLARAVRGEDTQDFIFKPQGFLASLGKGDAVAKIHGVRLYGFVAWFIWRTVYLTKLVGIQNTVRVVLDWTFDLFTSRDTSVVPT